MTRKMPEIIEVNSQQLDAWINREQQEVIEYLRTENQVLKEKLGKRRILLNDDQRRRLAVKGKILGRKRLTEIGTLFSADTIIAGTVTWWPGSGIIRSGRSRLGGHR